ncbi:hypothetical protein [Paraeggerthella hongkongensis]|nr:hypothetical protein [Paraeggerthella hongkongensis]
MMAVFSYMNMMMPHALSMLMGMRPRMRMSCFENCRNAILVS